VKSGVPMTAPNFPDTGWISHLIALARALSSGQHPNFVEQGLRGAMQTQGTPLPQMSDDQRMSAQQSLQGTGEMLAGLTPFDTPLAAVLAARDFGQGDWLSGLLNGAGVLPFVPPLGGVLGKADAAAGALSNRIPLGEALKYADPNTPLRKMRTQERAYLDNLKQQIQAEGIKSPLKLKRRPDGSTVIMDGNHRLAVAEELGLPDVPVEYIDDAKGR
jgi:hypothetical protein